MDRTAKRYWLFTYAQYYPGGGMSDYEGSFDTIEEAKSSPLYTRAEYAEIVDSVTASIVHEK